MSIVAFVKPLVERFPRIAALYRGMREELSFSEQPSPTSWGFKLAGNPLMSSGDFEPEETEIVRNLLSQADVLVNVGANIGYYCCHALSMGKEVIAFEPMQSNIRFLCKNIEANDWSCEIYPIALSKEIGILKMYGGGTGASLLKGWAGSSDNYTLVPCSTMDTVLSKRLEGKKVLFVVDVEGAEKWVLEGCPEILSIDPKPTWLIEIATTEQQPIGVKVNPLLADTFKLMFDAGYEATTADKFQNKVTIGDVKIAKEGKKTVLDSTHNFIFR